MPTWLKITLNILLNVVLVVCAVLFTIYTDVFDKYKKYTYQDLQDAYNTGYAQASAVVSDLQAKINELTESLTQKMQQVSDLQLQISDLQNENSELETDKQALEQQILELQNLVSQKDSEIADFKAEIERLKAELEIYANQELDFVYVTFYVDNEVYKTVSVRKEGSILINIAEPESKQENMVFAGWKNNDNLIDIANYSFIENTSLYATFEQMKLPNGSYSISFIGHYREAGVPGISDSVEFDADISFDLLIENHLPVIVNGDGEIFDYNCYYSYKFDENGHVIYDENYDPVIDEVFDVPRAFGYRFLYNSKKYEVLIGYNTTLSLLSTYKTGWHAEGKSTGLLIKDFSIL